jgi:hypothetical protein
MNNFIERNVATYRNPKLLALAKEAPHCMSCGRPQDGSVVAAHSDSLSHGKGTGHKASDACVAFLCNLCHYDIAVNHKIIRAEKRDKWEQAHMKTIRWLIETDRLKT